MIFKTFIFATLAVYCIVNCTSVPVHHFNSNTRIFKTPNKPILIEEKEQVDSIPTILNNAPLDSVKNKKNDNNSNVNEFKKSPQVLDNETKNDHDNEDEVDSTSETSDDTDSNVFENLSKTANNNENKVEISNNTEKRNEELHAIIKHLGENETDESSEFENGKESSKSSKKKEEEKEDDYDNDDEDDEKEEEEEEEEKPTVKPVIKNPSQSVKPTKPSQIPFKTTTVEIPVDNDLNEPTPTTEESYKKSPVSPRSVISPPKTLDQQPIQSINLDHAIQNTWDSQNEPQKSIYKPGEYVSNDPLPALNTHNAYDYNNPSQPIQPQTNNDYNYTPEYYQNDQNYNYQQRTSNNQIFNNNYNQVEANEWQTQPQTSYHQRTPYNQILNNNNYDQVGNNEWQTQSQTNYYQRTPNNQFSNNNNYDQVGINGYPVNYPPVATQYNGYKLICRNKIVFNQCSWYPSNYEIQSTPFDRYFEVDPEYYNSLYPNQQSYYNNDNYYNNIYG